MADLLEFFFFQAEDGIRDVAVTGVQTCALPISEPQIQEVLGISEKGHDYYLQITDARPDTGGLSGATPSEAVSWGKIDADQLPGTVVCYLDNTVGFPIVAAYPLAKPQKRRL